ncbi:hypothetical protein BCR37DRAFT_280681 [Protomyces lactucae-debilis]|uniref:Uncharacterized protein n=1 Tax=Protomyces lactucae-debilis TaxID=2754530 RepID=A0A1Y2FKS2_PROLT|nr:uncharacterized protein BCR37DRAFT_280681 [Protomyces lactucae-debilis]ORY83806.1 hypothetical protein BCR37DRAFT_280681 [Protomyces lactucae-debilis]
MASRLTWKSHVDNTVQFVLWASFGSAAIHLINIKQAYAEKERKLDTKIGILRNVIDRIGKGEQVDVGRELKVGKTEEEREWEEMMGAFRDDADKTLQRPATDAPAVQDANLDAKSSQPDPACQPVQAQRGRFWAS